MPKVRTRKLWLNIRYKIPSDVTHRRIIDTLIRSIRRGDYKLPRGWKVVIEWRNKEEAGMRRGNWTDEMRRSAESSAGFDMAVIRYLENQR